MYPRFGLILMVNHACNLRCSYCYMGRKFNRPMTVAIGRKSIDRAVASLRTPGELELGFFGGEPLLETSLVISLIDYARWKTAVTDRTPRACFKTPRGRVAADIGQSGALRARPLRVLTHTLTIQLTTNGTCTDPAAWSLMMEPDLELTVSFDGPPQVHDRHRRFANGNGSSAVVIATMRRLLDAEKDFSVNMVVRPDSAASLPDGIEFLRHLGVRYVELSLDLWTRWSADDIRRLETAIVRCARLWEQGLPAFGINWFDDKAARLAGVPIEDTARCGFGAGEVAVAPSGNLYPCERLIGEDAPANPIRLPGHALESDDFLAIPPSPGRSEELCGTCAIQSICNTTCRCGNYVRTGDVRRPDRLLSIWNQVCASETAGVLNQLGTRTTNRSMPYEEPQPSPRLVGAAATTERAD
jgi:uncharacterized protein